MKKSPQRDRALTKDETLQLRVSSEQKELIERAAALTGLSISSYMLSRTLPAAEQDVVQHERIVLSERDWTLFLSAVESPPTPNAALKKAALSFRKKYSDK